MVIDFDGLDQRIVALPADRANYQGLEVGHEGNVFLAVGPIALSDEDYVEYGGDENPPVSLVRFELKERKAEKFVDKLDGFFVTSADGSKLLFSHDKKWFVVPTDKTPKPGDGALKLDGVQVWIDPRAEWRQIYHEVWRIERDFLYDPHAHGLDLAAAEKLYASFLDGIAGRDDLNALLEEGLSNLVLGHVWARGGLYPKQDGVSVGLLGADYTVEHGRYKIARILPGENWNPKMRAPLTQPGVDVKEGQFVLAVNGNEVKADEDIYRFFLGTAGKQNPALTIATTADGAGSHTITVVPVASESTLRLRSWMEASKKRVDERSGGRVAYVFLPDTQGEGYTNFNRYFFSQVGKEGGHPR